MAPKKIVLSEVDEENREWLRAQLEVAGRGAKQALADHLGFTRPDAITRILNTDPNKESRAIKASELVKMREFFESAEVSKPAHRNSVPLMGHIGAGAEIDPEFEQVPPEGLEQIDVPFELPGEMIAFRVRGDSMLPRYDEDDVVVVWKDQKRGTDSFLGEEVAVRTRGGRRYLKTLMKSDGDYNLISFNAKPIQGVTIEWIGEIYVTVRASQFRRRFA